MIERFGRPERTGRAEIEREDRHRRVVIRVQQFDQRRVRHALGPDHGAPELLCLPRRVPGDVRNACIHPKLDGGKGGMDRFDRSEVVALSLDRVDVREIECLERMQLQQCRCDLDRLRAGRE